MGFVGNKKNIKYHQTYPLMSLMSLMNLMNPSNKEHMLVRHNENPQYDAPVLHYFIHSKGMSY